MSTKSIISTTDARLDLRAAQGSRLRRMFRTLHTLRGRAWDWLMHRCLWAIGNLSAPGQWPAGQLQRIFLQALGVRCAGDVWVGAGTVFDNPGRLILGQRVVIGAGSRFTGAKADIMIGDDFLSAPGLMINTGSHDLLSLEPVYHDVQTLRGVWCGARVTICAGVTIGEGAVIGAGALVVRSLPARMVSLGVPAKPVRALPEVDLAQRWTNFGPATEGIE